ncbi:hypothetical protein PACTADRAFT_34789 [Pachysolen tannophilus NRRL Y-2460]|uniref:Vacuolar transporter chaperone complex subunit 4 n=1 Tax=Pachysolen tannophilus NRRL Y-2460 TaxID=669874 RepID=A0A1E4TTJ9_PACTA|nr:hypothetical protein PACTADRAFT_34789 [Pachysolen tannophilus NRRL Y-2460]
MKFGETLKSSLIPDYNYYYIQYDDLKHRLKKGLSVSNNQWTNELEEDFVSILEKELNKVFNFVHMKHEEILRRIKNIEALVYQTVENSKSCSNEQELELFEQDFEDLEEELSDIIADVHDLAKFSRLNYIGFQKILKKHDKQTNNEYILKPIFQARLDARAFYKDNYDDLIVKLSKLYDLVRTRGNPVKGDSSAGGSQQNFVRQTTKYWVHPDNITELKLIILKHLPVLVFNASKEFEKEDSAITSIYYDNKNMDLYYGRLLKDEGAEAIRLRWYGGMSTDTIFVERKTHREDWTGEKSVKARFTLKEKNVNDFMKGKKKSPQEIESLERLANEVQYRVIKDKMRPVMRSFYNRTAFQLPGDARVRISLDTELTMVREDNFDGIDRTRGNWRRMDIGIDYPFENLPEKDVCRFPYAVLEVKLQTQMGQEPPTWVRELVSSHLVEAVPKFSKFIHGCASLLPNQINLIPFWLPQMDVDIRKPKKNEEFGIIRQNNHSLTAGSSSYGEMDEEEFIGSATTGTGSYSSTNDTGEESLHGGSGSGPGSNASGTGSASGSGSGSGNNSGIASGTGTGGGSRAPVVQFSPGTRRGDSYDSENTPLLSSRRASKQGNGVGGLNGFSGLGEDNNLSLLQKIEKYIQEIIKPDHRFNKVPQGTSFDTKITAPPGKKIAVPVRVEPKVYFATERTYLNWTTIGMLLGATASTLLNYGNTVSLLGSIGFFITAFTTIFYAMCMYLWRVFNIRKKRAVRYDDQIGPRIICACLAISLAANFLYRYLEH